MRSRVAALAVMAVVGVLAVVAALSGRAGHAGAITEEGVSDQLATDRPIPALDTVWIEQMTWMEVRDALAEGRRTAIVPTGGIEESGPYVATGKHNFVVEETCERIARALGDALCAPIVALVPEGDITPPSGHMLYPGTISVREDTFEDVLEDVGRSLHQHGFEAIVYIGDHGSTQMGMRKVADRLNKDWGTKAGALFIPEYYDNDGVERHMTKTFGIVEESEGFHDYYWLTAMQAAVDPETVRYEQRVQAGLASINGVSLTPLKHTIAVGEELMRWRTERTVSAIRAARGY